MDVCLGGSVQIVQGDAKSSSKIVCPDTTLYNVVKIT